MRESNLRLKWVILTYSHVSFFGSFLVRVLLNCLADPGKARGCSKNTFVLLNYIDIFSEILNLEGHQNCRIGSKVTAILLNGWILPTGGVSSGRVCSCSLRSWLVHLPHNPLTTHRSVSHSYKNWQVAPLEINFKVVRILYRLVIPHNKTTMKT